MERKNMLVSHKSFFHVLFQNSFAAFFRAYPSVGQAFVGLDGQQS
jgi:hypothetical protein